MAKKKTTSSKRSTTSSAKKKGLFGKLNLTSKRNQFIAVILIVAVMGGGWFTYKSFAGNQTVFGVNDMRCDPLWSSDGYCKRIEETQKGGNDVFLLAANSGKRGWIITRSSVSITRGWKYTTCVTAKGVGTINLSYRDSETQTVSGDHRLSFNNRNSYITECYTGIPKPNAFEDRTKTTQNKIELIPQPDSFLTVSLIKFEQSAAPIPTSGSNK